MRTEVHSSSMFGLFSRLFGEKHVPSVQFDPTTLPWIDRTDWRKKLLTKSAMGEVTPSDAVMLQSWNKDGFTVLRGAVEETLIDALWRDEARAWRERPVCKILSEGVGIRMLADSAPKETFVHHHYRIMDFHNLSQAGAQILMHPKILRILQLIFGESVIAMQSLLFEYGSEQHLHQDFPYVHAEIPSHLIGVWVACEDADAENGSLLYYPSSHRLPLFDFGDGSVLYKNDDPKKIDAFEKYLTDTCATLPRTPQILNAKKGDVLMWHGALVHGGSPTHNHVRTRKSLVSHYSTNRAYTQDRRSPDRSPLPIVLHGGSYHAWQFPDHKEGRYKL